MVVAGAVGRKAPARGGKLTPHRLLHHREFDPRSPAHRVAGAHRLHRAELAEAHQVRIEEPDPRRARHGEDRGLRLEDHQLSRAHVHAHGADAPLLSVHRLRQQRGGLHAVADAHAQAAEFPVERRLECGAPDPQSEAVLIVIGKQEPRLLVPELRAGEFPFAVPDLSAEVLQIQQPVIAFAAFDVMRNAVGVAVLLLHIGLGDLLRRHARAGVAAGRFPVVKAAPGRAAALCRAFLDQRDALSPPSRRDRRKASGEAAAQDQQIAFYGFPHAEFIRIGPFVIVLHSLSRSPHLAELPCLF